MKESEVLNFVTTQLGQQFDKLGISQDIVKWPNTVIDLKDVDIWYEVHLHQTLLSTVTLSKTARVYGTVIISIFTPIGDGNGYATDQLEAIAPALAKMTVNGISFDNYELVQLEHTLSQTQTTTDISHNQVNLNINYTYVR